jgi:hypothetical protein
MDGSFRKLENNLLRVGWYATAALQSRSPRLLSLLEMFHFIAFNPTLFPRTETKTSSAAPCRCCLVWGLNTLQGGREKVDILSARRTSALDGEF